MGWGFLTDNVLLLAASEGTPVSSLAKELFPLPVQAYDDAHLGSLSEVLLHRIQVEPLNLAATAIFFLAIVHTFCAPMFLRWARRLEERNHLRWLERSATDTDDREPASSLAIVLHYLGEIEAVFGVWAVPLVALIALVKGWGAAETFLEKGVHFNEAVFVVVVMAIAATQPVLYLAESVLSRLAGWGGGTPFAWWCTLLTVGPILGSFITEPAAMTICAILLAQHFFRYRPSTALSYATVAILFSNISLGGVLTNFAAPPIIIVSREWGWDTQVVWSTFGLKALCGVLTSTLAYQWLFRRELRQMCVAAQLREERSGPVHERSVPFFVILGNVVFLTWTVAHAESARLVIIGFLFFLAFVDATRHFQRSVSLRPALLVGFFLAGLVIHGSFQAWWIEPVFSRFGETTLFASSVVLSAFNDNASITYLASLVPDFSDGFKYSVVSGALAGGGLTIIANAPNPAGNTLLARFFEGGISPLKLLIAALLPLLINVLIFHGVLIR
jgi:hypothetical protein